MKRIILSIFLFGIFNTGLRAQEYTPLLDAFNEWHFTTCYFGCLTDVYYTDGDTLVDGVPHKILDGFHYISRTFLLKEDVAQRKVWMTKVNAGGNSEYLLYDFSLEEGDSIEMLNPITPFPPNGGYFTLDSIRLRPLVDGEDYRHFYFSPSESNTTSTNNAVWVEGLGSLSLINAPGGKPDINEVGQLSCFFKNGSHFYENLDSINSCDPVLSVFDITHPMEEIELRNNTATNSFVFRNTQSVKWYGIYNITGEKLDSKIIMEPENELSITMESAASGLYLIVFRNSMNQEISFKLLVN